MNASEPIEPVLDVIQVLEKALAKARMEKALALDPALAPLRRLRNVIRLYIVFGVYSLLLMPLAGVGLRLLHNTVNSMGSDLISVLAFFLYTALTWIASGISLLLLFAYLRFLKQFREIQLHDIENTTGIILRLWNFMLLFTIFSNVLVIIAKFSPYAALVLDGAYSGSIGGLFVGVLLYFVIRHYVKTAQAELPKLVSVAVNNAPSGRYYAWKPLFLMLLLGTSVVLGLGYWLGEKISLNSAPSVNQVLAEASNTLNASLPKQVDSDVRLDKTSSGPGNKMTYFFTLVNFSVADLDPTKTTDELRENLESN